MKNQKDEVTISTIIAIFCISVLGGIGMFFITH